MGVRGSRAKRAACERTQSPRSGNHLPTCLATGPRYWIGSMPSLDASLRTHRSMRVSRTLCWIAHTHAMDAFESTRRLAFLSPEPGSGKTRALEVTEPLVPRPIEAVNVTPAYLFRKVADEGGPPTILFDEIDTVFGPKAKDNEEIRGLLNAGHRKGAVAGRCVIKGKTVTTEEIPAYCAVALAGLGGLPDTILSRSATIRMRRRAPDEKVEPWRRRIHAPEAEGLRDQLAVWAEGALGRVIDTWPEMPPGVNDRVADVWEALLAVADVAEGNWPARARAAAVAFVTERKDSSPSLGVRLLSDFCSVFAEADKAWTDDILAKLHALDDAPWGDLGVSRSATSGSQGCSTLTA